MVRVPGSINSKNGEHVKIVQEWDGNRPDIMLLMGSFYAHLATKKKKEKEFTKIQISIIIEISNRMKFDGLNHY